jgi:hypothetical protein
MNKTSGKTFAHMKTAYRKLKKPILVIIISLFIVVIVVILFISPITKYLIEKYDEKYTGRQIKTGWVYVNPFTGYIHISNLRIYETQIDSGLIAADSIFFSSQGLSANFSLLKLLSKNIEITELYLEHPKGSIIQNNKDFNINDLIKKFTPEKTDTIKSKVHFSILKITINKGEFYYFEKGIPVEYYIKETNIVSSGLLWNNDTIGARFAFLSGTDPGIAKGKFSINFKSLDYRFEAILQNFDLKFIEQYLRDLSNYGNFRGKINAAIKTTGNLKEAENLDVIGKLELSDFHIGNTADDDIASFDKLLIKMHEFAPMNHIYQFDSIILNRPFLKYETYDYLDNIERMFGKKGDIITATKADPGHFNLILKIADYVTILSKNFFKSDYKIDKLAVYKGRLKFNDYALAEEFSVSLDPLYAFADSVNKNHKRVDLSFKSDLKPYGNILVNLSLNPRDSGDFDMEYHLSKLPVSMFNPYLVTYTSFPLDRGTIEINGKWSVRNSQINSINHLLVLDPRVSKRIRTKDAKWLPTNLIMFFIRDRGNVIDYEIPVTGNLKNPRFHLKDVILDILGNIFVKPVTTPYRIDVRNTENEIEKSLNLKWATGQNSLLPDQEKFLDKMAGFLKNNPTASISVYPMQYAAKEKESLRFFEAKKKYFFSTRNGKDKSLSGDDSLELVNMSVKDSSFVHYLDHHVTDSMLFTVQDKCINIIGETAINSKYNALNKKRENSFILCFRKRSVEDRVKIYTGENTIPYNGFSFYKIEYKGDLPEYLILADERMNQFNNAAPRKWFRKERAKDEK